MPLGFVGACCEGPPSLALSLCLLLRKFLTRQVMCHSSTLNACIGGAQCSMSRKGNCWDNAVVESFFSSLKLELREQFHRVSCRIVLLEFFDTLGQTRSDSPA